MSLWGGVNHGLLKNRGSWPQILLDNHHCQLGFDRLGFFPVTVVEFSNSAQSTNHNENLSKREALWFTRRGITEMIYELNLFSMKFCLVIFCSILWLSPSFITNRSGVMKTVACSTKPNLSASTEENLSPACSCSHTWPSHKQWSLGLAK